jgi:hypothetical protein
VNSEKTIPGTAPGNFVCHPTTPVSSHPLTSQAFDNYTHCSLLTVIYSLPFGSTNRHLTSIIPLPASIEPSKIARKSPLVNDKN